MKLYHAIIWKTSDQPGHRVSVTAANLAEAKEKLESEYGEGTVFDLHNKEDAARPRLPDPDNARSPTPLPQRNSR